MWKTRLILSTNPDFGIPTEAQIELFHRIGFDGFFTDWSRGCPMADWRALADRLGAIYHAVHAPFGRAADLWKEGEAGRAAVAELSDCLSDCASYGVPIMIAHAYIGFEEVAHPTAAGIENFSKVVGLAERLGVRIALENTEGEDYLAALMDAFRGSAAVGYCWDSGHEICYNHSKRMLELYGDRLLITHLNDNLGIRDYSGKITWKDDLHLLPFDGIADWQTNMVLLRDAAGDSFDGVLTFELNRSSKPERHENDGYGRMELVDYLTEAYKRACRLAAIYRNGYADAR